ncbi:MAG: hypothetical protein F4W95_15150 [Chloroflexi bacterium]|nr:hypothetical protein [Chloroflexota bacterium]MYD49794.1 hypothetical protein [Chloroflexota bacterium]
MEKAKQPLRKVSCSYRKFVKNYGFIGYIAMAIAMLVGIGFPWLFLSGGFRWAILECYGTPGPSFLSGEGAAVLGALVIALLVMAWLALEKKRTGSLARMRYAIAALTLIALVVLSWSMHSWTWLGSGSESNSATVRNIGFAVAAVLTLIFVIWRERIASWRASAANQQVTTEHSRMLLEQYRGGLDMLTSDFLAVRIGGVYVLQKLGNEQGYCSMCLEVLRAFQKDANEEEATAAENAINALEALCGKTGGTGSP